jgi:putative phosphoesterase
VISAPDHVPAGVPIQAGAQFEVLVQIAIVSDTHLPRGLRRLPDLCVERLVEADLVIHAGDFVRLAILRELESYSRRLVAVHGNVDELDVRDKLPEVAWVDARGARIAVIHDAGPAAGRLERLRSKFPDADAVVFGHSHLPLHQVDRSGFQIFNPGSPTERRRAPHHTMGLARAVGGRLSFELIELD